MILTLAQVVLVFYLLMIVIELVFVKVLIILFVCYVIYTILKKESTFEMYEDRIDFKRKYLDKKLIKSIPFSKIDQVRYEDQFSGDGFTYSLNTGGQIFLYINDPEDSPEKAVNNKVVITIDEERQREQILIKILKVFKEHKIEIYVSTKYKNLLKELELKNWTNP